MAAPSRPMKVLMLCGYLQTGRIFSGRLGNLRKATKDFAELVFIDPPFVIEGEDNVDPEAPPLDTLKPEDYPRGWWMMRGEEGRRNYTNFDECLTYVRDVLDKQGPFDAVFGFSQGAGLAAIVTALVEKPELHPAFASCTHPPFRFSVIAAGFEPLDPRASKLFYTPVKTPSLHIIGKADPIVVEERSLKLADGFLDARVEFHDGGHFIPSKTPWKNFLKAYIQAFVNEEGAAARALAVPSPTPTPADPVDAPVREVLT
ncbi:hypothetical protein P7C70_g2079, partial [Phenoliferia sp. Uapishka_3]